MGQCTPHLLIQTVRQRYAIATLRYIRTQVSGIPDLEGALTWICAAQIIFCVRGMSRGWLVWVEAVVSGLRHCARRGVSPFQYICEPLLTCRRFPDGYFVTTRIPNWAFINVTVSP